MSFERPYTGFVDSGFTFVPEVLDHHHHHPWVVIRRPREEVVNSLVMAGFGHPGLADILELTDHFLKKVSSLKRSIVVDYDELDDPTTGARIWYHCRQDSFPADRWERLQRMNIDIQSNKIMQGVTPWFGKKVLSSMKPGITEV